MELTQAFAHAASSTCCAGDKLWSYGAVDRGLCAPAEVWPTRSRPPLSRTRPCRALFVRRDTLHSGAQRRHDPQWLGRRQDERSNLARPEPACTQALGRSRAGSVLQQSHRRARRLRWRQCSSRSGALPGGADETVDVRVRSWRRTRNGSRFKPVSLSGTFTPPIVSRTGNAQLPSPPRATPHEGLPNG